MPRRRKDAKTSDDEDDSVLRKVNKHLPVQRHAANERERSRMRVLSKAFSKLKTTLPWVPSDTKLSKLDTLRLASSYIAHLKQILDGNEEEVVCHQSTNIHPLNLTWPFSFQGKGDHSNLSPLDSTRSDKDTSSLSEDHNLDDLVTESP
ncbi:transcription factor 21-like [Mya arenaria]|uniref:transcription factor 21-like n=1 Tax=Mya arenaria TaxID=6604 RepID=UPI0022E47D49|nr:transcription factor 21-like [Mya arenaria]XP_052777601.1 transcription factor 21-like [Mya arenaria]